MEPFEKLIPFVRADGEGIGIAQIDHMQVETVGGAGCAHITAKRIRRTGCQALYAHQRYIFSVRLVVLIGKPLAKNAVKQFERVQIAGVYAQNDGWRGNSGRF